MLLVTAFVFGWAIYNTITNPDELQQVLMSWGLFAFTILMTPLLITMRINEVVKKETPELRESTDTIEVTKAKILRNNDKIEGKMIIGWHQVEAVAETKEYIYLYTGPTSGIFIVIADIIEGDIETFRKLAMGFMRKNRKGKVAYKKYRKGYNQ